MQIGRQWRIQSNSDKRCFHISGWKRDRRNGSCFKRKVDAIILTGGIAHQETTVKNIKSMVEFIAEVIVYPGEDELKALAFNGLLALDGKIEIKTYK